MRVAIYYSFANERSKLIAKALLRGIGRHEGNVQFIRARDYQGKPEADVAIHYGFAEGLRRIFEQYRDEGRKAVYVDLGYWHRRKRTRFDGYHKLVLNSRHPTEYFQNKRHAPDRFNRLGVKIAPWRKAGRHIVVVGMSGKGALAEGFRPEQWERQTIAQLRELTDRPIIYRPKPNWQEARPIPGTIFQRGVELDEALRNCHAVVCHHSNVAVDAILAGVPAICPIGVASVMGGTDLTHIESPPMPDGRHQWAADIAYTQYTMDEMISGEAWQYLKSEVLA